MGARTRPQESNDRQPGKQAHQRARRGQSEDRDRFSIRFSRTPVPVVPSPETSPVHR